MPAADWNGKFLAVGNGGFGGSIQGYNDMQVALRRGYATAGNDTGHTAADGPNGDVRTRPPGEDRRLLASRDARDGRDLEAAGRCVLQQAASVLLLQRLLDRRTPGRDGRAAIPRRFRWHHRRRAGQSPHPDAHRRRRAQHRAVSASGTGDPRVESGAGLEGDHERLRPDEGRFRQQPACVHVRCVEAGLLDRPARTPILPDTGADEDGRDVLQRREEQQG